MANGMSIAIANGVVTVVKDPMMDDKSELELANAKITELQTQLDAEKSKVIAAENAKAEIEIAVALVKELQGLKNSWKPESRGKFSSTEKVGEIDLNQVRELNKKLNAKKE
jgi:hypothetical protein